MEYVVILFNVRNVNSFVTYRLKDAIVRIISAVVPDICVVEQFKKIFID